MHHPGELFEGAAAGQRLIGERTGFLAVCDIADFQQFGGERARDFEQPDIDGLLAGNAISRSSFPWGVKRNKRPPSFAQVQ